MVPDNPWLERRVIGYAHQGGAWEGPSSTLYAIGQAIDSGASAIELDVHATLDGHLVVCHDATVDRTTDGHGAIAQLTLAQVQALDNAHWFVPGCDAAVGLDPDAYPLRGRAPDDRDLRIPTLREVLDRFPGVVLNLDIKQTAPAVVPYEEALARLLWEYGRQDDVIVASFLDAATEAFARFAPTVATSAGAIATAMWWRALNDTGPLPQLRAAAFQVPERQGGVTVVDERFVAASHDAGLAVHVWTVNDAASMRRVLDLGVDGIISDVPSTLSDVLATRRVSWRGLL